MYSLSLGPWLKEFEAKQFIIKLHSNFDSPLVLLLFAVQHTPTASFQIAGSHHGAFAPETTEYQKKLGKFWIHNAVAFAIALSHAGFPAI